MSDNPDVLALALKKFTPQEIGVTVSNTFRFACEVHCAKKNLTYRDTVYVKDLAVFRDYEDNFADVIEISLMFPMGTFMYDVYDDLENVEITLKELTQFYEEPKARVETKPQVKLTRYKAIYLKDKNKAIPNTRAMSRDDLNQRLPIVVMFQLIEKPVEAMRIKTTGGSFYCPGGVTAEQFLRTTFSQESNKILVDNRKPIDVFDIVKFDNTEAIKHILIPTHTRLIELPDYLQEKLGGIYNDGLACYVQCVMTKPGEYKNTLAIFNLYDPDTPGTADSLMYCLNDSAQSTNYVGGIHDKSGKGIHLLAHRLSGIEDDKTTKVVNRGTGFRVTDASKIVDAPVDYRPNGAVINRNKIATEITGKDRQDGGNFAIDKGISYNNLALTTDVFKRTSTTITAQVSNLDHTLIAPGKKYEVHYLTSELLADGTVQKKMAKRYAYILQVLSAYTNNNPDLIANSNGTYIELTNHTTLKMVVGKILNTEDAG